MKVVVITILILIMFFVAALYINGYMQNSSEELTSIINKLDDAIESEDWETAHRYKKDFVEKWEKEKPRWQTFLEHYEIDRIDITLAKIVRYVDIQERNLALGETATLQLLIKHTTEKEDFKLTNIL